MTRIFVLIEFWLHASSGSPDAAAQLRSVPDVSDASFYPAAEGQCLDLEPKLFQGRHA
jgi:hypothetical protein